MARCLRCKAGNEWIEGDVRPRSKKDERRIVKLIAALATAREFVDELAAAGNKHASAAVKKIDSAIHD